MLLSSREYRAVVRGVRDALARSDAIVLRALGRTRARLKPDGSEVTAADRAAERALRAELALLRPSAKVCGEEYGGDD